MRIIEEKPEIWPFILASIIIHALLFTLVPQIVKSSPSFKEDPIEVFAVSDMPKSENMPHRIADIEKPQVEQRPDSAKFLGMYDSKVPDETVGIFRPGKTKIGGDTQGKFSPPKIKKDVGGTKAATKNISKGDLFAFNKDIFDDTRESAAKSESKLSGNGDNALNDYYPDFRRGANTYLNVLRYPGVEYFVRLKHAFKIAFNPEPSLMEHFSRNLVTRGSIDVVLGVTVGRSGELSELFVFRTSGIPSYDQEALRTVRASSPFSSPPEKFLSKDGALHMSWTFSVYL